MAGRTDLRKVVARVSSLLGYRLIALGILTVVVTVAVLNFVPASAAYNVKTTLQNIPAELENQGSMYISLMDNIPGIINGNSELYADSARSEEVYLKVYAVNNSNRTLRLDFVQRDVGPNEACRNFDIRYDLIGLNGSETGSNSQFDGGDIPLINPGGFSGNCAGSGVNIPIDGSKLGASSVVGHFDSSGTSLKTGLIRLKIRSLNGPSASHSPTFKASISGSCPNNCARIGYAGQFSGFGGAADPQVAIYPSNLNNNYDMDFPTVPPCGTPAGEKTIYWEDDDKGVSNKNQAVNSNVVNDVAYSPAPPGSINSIRADVIDITDGTNATVPGSQVYSGSGPGGQIKFDYTPGHKYKLKFQNVTGGNRIIFHFRYDSANIYFPCPTGEGWGLQNNTNKNYDTIGVTEPTIPTYISAPGPPPVYTPVPKPAGYYPGIPCNATYDTPDVTPDTASYANCIKWNTYYGVKTSRTITALNQVRFTHQVGNVTDLGKDIWGSAPSGTHFSDINYHFIRFNGTADPYNPRYGGLNWTANIAPGQWKYPYSPDSPTLNSTQSVAMNILGDPADSTRYGDPRTGDKYCEELQTAPGNSSGGSIPRSYGCVTLEVGSCDNGACDVCDGQPWVIQAYADTQKNSGFGLGDNPAAWVGDSYGVYYAFGKYGPAESTSNIDFRSINNDVAPASVVTTWSQTLTALLNNSIGQQRRIISIGPADGGKTFKSYADWAPNQGTYDNTTNTNCATSGSSSIPAPDVYVPYYYHLKPTSSGVSDKTQQGDPVTPSLGIDLPAQDNQGDLTGEAAADNEFGGRLHTWSTSTNWRIIEFRTSDIDDAKNKIPKNRSGGSGDCAEITSFGIAGFSGCGNVGAGSQVFTIGNANFSYTRPGNIVDPVNTKVCYVGVVGRPTHNAGPAWRYSNVSCTTIVKSPKVQFLNGDLTVGRYRAGDGATATQNCTPPDVGAIIRTAGAPSGASLLPPGENVNHYGSWVEYGAFAKGSITDFGTAAYANSGANNEQKLMFSNDPDTGNYTYPSNCLSNPFAQVEESADVNYIDTMNPEDLKLNQFFATAPYNTSAQDKAGYVANNQAGDNPKNVEIEQAPGPAAPLDENFNAFKGRDILIWARKGAAACNTAGAGGNITIKTDINYKKTGYGDISELPRIILLADCKIIIEDNVKRVDAWLMAKDAVETCSAATGQKFASAPFVTHTDCPDQLVINGPVQARRLLLWRTHGSDLTDLTSAKQAAEIFNLRPDQLLATYARGSDAGKPQTIYQTDLPPLY